MYYTYQTGNMKMQNKSNTKKQGLTLFINLSLVLTLLLFRSAEVKAQDPPVCHYNACSEGPLCYFGDTYYSPGDYIFDDTIDFYTAELKVVPQPYYEQYQNYICGLADCQSGASPTVYCEDGAVRGCGVCDPYDPYNPCDPYNPYASGSPHRCTSSGNWTEVPPDTPISGDCEEMLDTMKIAFTPGYIRTYTPYLFDIWRNTVDKTQAIFTPFRTVLDKPIFDWPGESTVTYEFEPLSGEGHAEGGLPPSMYPGWYTKFYFRYLGYIHCAKENLLQKISPILDRDHPYIYYDERCNVQLW
jgi:hypothetical protein